MCSKSICEDGEGIPETKMPGGTPTRLKCSHALLPSPASASEILVSSLIFPSAFSKDVAGTVEALSVHVHCMQLVGQAMPSSQSRPIHHHHLLPRHGTARRN